MTGESGKPLLAGMDPLLTKKDSVNTSPPAALVKHPHKAGRVNYSQMHIIVFIFLTFNSGLAIYRSINEPWTIAYVSVCYVDLLLLFWCLRIFEETPESSPTRGRLKVLIWLSTTLLTVMFSYKVASMMPLPVVIIVWAMAACTTIGGFYAFFIYRENTDSGVLKV